MQEPKPLLELQDEDAALLAGWYAVAYDLQHVISATELLLNLQQQPNPDGTLMRSLWSSALISYVRCFGSGRRARIDPAIYAQLQGAPIETHQYYKDTRDKHIAHPVNAFEEVRVGLMTDDSGGVVGVGHLAVFRVADAPEGVAQLRALASVAMQHVLSVIKPLKDAIVTRAKENPDLVATLKSLHIQPQGGGDAARTPRPARG